MLEIRQANGPALAMGRAFVVAWRELLQADHPQPASGQIEQRGAAHGTEPDNRDVEGPHDASQISSAQKVLRAVIGQPHRQSTLKSPRPVAPVRNLAPLSNCSMLEPVGLQ